MRTLTEGGSDNTFVGQNSLFSSPLFFLLFLILDVSPPSCAQASHILQNHPKSMMANQINSRMQHFRLKLNVHQTLLLYKIQRRQRRAIQHKEIVIAVDLVIVVTTVGRLMVPLPRDPSRTMGNRIWVQANR